MSGVLPGIHREASLPTKVRKYSSRRRGICGRIGRIQLKEEKEK